jgi:hypothetical protein
MRPDHSLRQVIVEGNLGNLKKGQKMKPVSEEAFRKAPQAFIVVFPARPEEEALFQEPDSPPVDGYPNRLPIFSKTQDVSKNALQDLVVFQKRFGGVFKAELAHLSQEMDEALLFPSRKPVVGRIEVGHKDTPVIFGEDRFGNLGSPGLGNPVVGKPFVDYRPEPVTSSTHLPSRLIHMKVGTFTNRFKDLPDFDAEPFAHPLEGLGKGPFRDLEVSQAFKEFSYLIERKPVVIFQDDGLNEDIGTEVPVRDFLGGIGSGDHLLAMGAVVTVFLKKGDLRMGGDQVFLGVFNHFLRGAQPAVAIRAVFQGLFDHPVDSLGLQACEAHMPRLLAGNLGASYPLGKPEGLQEFLLGLFLFLLPELSFKLLDTLLFLQDDFNQLFFGFLGEEELAVFSHSLKNGQEGEFFEGIASGG